MYLNKYGGLLVAIDGPNGVGKSTLITGVKDALMNKSELVLVTKEPTLTQLGEFTNIIAEEINGVSLACLVAADRYWHLETEVIPNLKRKYIIIMDRYILSSLILQRIDGVDNDFILSINNNIIQPDLQFAIVADADVIQQRLHERSTLTRFEREGNTLEEIKYLNEGIDCLVKHGVDVLRLANDSNLDQNISFITEEILKRWKR